MLVVAFPLMILAAVVIKLDSPGPVFFIQERVGARRRNRGGHAVWQICKFPFYKLRTMGHNVDQSAHREYIEAFVNGDVKPTGEKFKLVDDPRVTRVGKILRKTSLDELPQLLNVLKGEMSLVGPRPVPVYEAAHYQESHFERLCALPGITGLWQVRGRCQVPFDEMIRMDIEYVRNQSVWLDLKILFRTIPAVLTARGAD